MDFIKRFLVRDSRHIWLIYAMAFCFVAFPMFGGFTYSTLALQATEKDAAVVNLSGRQRMLSQQILLHALQFTQSNSYLQQTQLQHSRDEFALNHQTLLEYSLRYSQTKSIYLDSHGSTNLNQLVKSFIARADVVLASNADNRMEAMIDLQALGAEKLLNRLDDAVSQFEQTTVMNRDYLLTIQKVTLVVGLFILALEFLLIFMPVLYSAKQTIKRLAEEKEKLSQTKQRISYQSAHDHLTGLYNRITYNQKLEEFIESARFHAKIHSLLYIDLDNFKLVNDISGYSAGDALLIRVAGLLKQFSNDDDCIARLGNDEFVIVLNETTISDATAIADKIVAAFHQLEFFWDDQQFPITASIGVCEINPYISNAGQVKRLADAARQSAKRQGKDQVFVQPYQEIDKLNDLEYKTWVNTVQLALTHDLFSLYAQKIVSTNNTAETSHYEILIRLTDANGEAVSPGQFIPCAERYGLISAIDTWVIDNTFRWIEQNRAFAKELSFSINVSGSSIGKDRFLKHVVRQLKQFKIAPKSICFEITETAVVENRLKAQQFIATLREMGCRFAIDDFGCGLSSYAYLKEFDVDYLKIDGSFVKNVVKSDVDRTIVESMHNVGKRLGLKTVAEFVNNESVYQIMQSMQIDYLQGFYLDEPKPINELLPVQQKEQLPNKPQGRLKSA